MLRSAHQLAVPLPGLQLPASSLGPYPPHSAGNVTSSRALHPGIRLLFLSEVRPSLEQPMGQRRSGPTAVTGRHRARPAQRQARRPRIRAPRGKEKRSRRDRTGAGPTQAPRPAEMARRHLLLSNLRDPTAPRPPHLHAGQWRPLPPTRRRSERAAYAAGSCSSGRRTSGLGGCATAIGSRRCLP